MKTFFEPLHKDILAVKFFLIKVNIVDPITLKGYLKIQILVEMQTLNNIC